MGSPPRAVVSNTVCGSWLDARRAAGKTSPCGPTRPIERGPVPLKVCIWCGSLGQGHEPPLRTKPMQRMKCLEPCPAQTPYFLWEKLSGQAGRQGAGLSPRWSQAGGFSPCSPPSTPSRPRGLTAGCGPFGQGFSLAQGPGPCLSWNLGGSAVAVATAAFWTVCQRLK